MDDNRIEGTVKKVAGTIQGAYGNLTDNSSQELKGNAKRVIGNVQNALGKAEDCVRDSIDSVQSRVTEKPMQSALLALGIGYILGRIFNL